MEASQVAICCRPTGGPWRSLLRENTQLRRASCMEKIIVMANLPLLSKRLGALRAAIVTVAEDTYRWTAHPKSTAATPAAGNEDPITAAASTCARSAHSKRRHLSEQAP